MSFFCLCQSGPSTGYHVYVWMKYAVLEYACSLAPAWNPDPPALTHVLGATRAHLEFLDASLDPCGWLSADTSFTSSLLPCYLVPNGTNKLSAPLLNVLCWDWLKQGDWPCHDMSTDSRTQPPRPGHVACLWTCVTGFWLLDCNVIPLWEKKI